MERMLKYSKCKTRAKKKTRSIKWTNDVIDRNCTMSTDFFQTLIFLDQVRELCDCKMYFLSLTMKNYIITGERNIHVAMFSVRTMKRKNSKQNLGDTEEEKNESTVWTLSFR